MVLAAGACAANTGDGHRAARRKERAVALDAVVLLAAAAVETAACASQCDGSPDYGARIVDPDFVAHQPQGACNYVNRGAAAECASKVEAIVCAAAGPAIEILRSDRRCGHN